MTNLFDMLSQSQNGAGMQALASQFGLNQDQVNAAMEALLPAFSTGLKRNTADPFGMGKVMQAMMTGQNHQYFDNPAAAFTKAGMDNGNAILGQLFGSKDLSRAVAAQASAASGIGQDVLKQMLPALASMIMGGLFKQSTNQFSAGSFGASGNIFGQVIEEMMKQGGAAQRQTAPQADNPLGKILEGMLGGGQAAPQQAPQQSDNPLGRIFEEMMKGGMGQGGSQGGGAQPGQMDNPLGKILEGMLGGGQAAPRRTTPAPEADNPFGKILEEMMGGGARRESAEEDAAPRVNPSGRPRNKYDDAFGEMFETGRKTRDSYQQGMESIFDQFLKGMDRHG